MSVKRVEAVVFAIVRSDEEYVSIRAESGSPVRITHGKYDGEIELRINDTKILLSAAQLVAAVNAVTSY